MGLGLGIGLGLGLYCECGPRLRPMPIGTIGPRLRHRLRPKGFIMVVKLRL